MNFRYIPKNSPHSVITENAKVFAEAIFKEYLKTKNLTEVLNRIDITPLNKDNKRKIEELRTALGEEINKNKKLLNKKEIAEGLLEKLKKEYYTWADNNMTPSEPAIERKKSNTETSLFANPISNKNVLQIIQDIKPQFSENVFKKIEDQLYHSEKTKLQQDLFFSLTAPEVLQELAKKPDNVIEQYVSHVINKAFPTDRMQFILDFNSIIAKEKKHIQIISSTALKLFQDVLAIMESNDPKFKKYHNELAEFTQKNYPIQLLSTQPGFHEDPNFDKIAQLVAKIDKTHKALLKADDLQPKETKRSGLS